MKKRNVFVKTAVATALMVFGVSAIAVGVGSTSNTTPVNIAKEAFGTAVTTVTAISTSANGITYTFATPGGIVINPGGQIYLTLQATGGTLGQTGPFALTVPTTAGGTLTTSTASIAGGVITVTLINSAVGLNANTVLGVGASINVGKVLGANANGVGVGLVTVSNTGLAAGTKVTVSGKVGVTAGGEELETASPAADLLTTSTAVVATPSASVTEDAKIDLAVVPAGSKLTPGAVQTHDLGSVKFVTNPTAAYQLDAATVVNVLSATAFSGVTTYDLTKVTGAWTAGATYLLNSAAGCGGATTIASTQTNTPAGAVSTSTTKVTLVALAGVRPAENTPVYLCATYPVAAISPNKLSVTGTLAKFNTSYVDVPVAATSLYDLQNNGKTIYVRDLVNPMFDVDVGYQGSVRIINTGTIAAPVTAAWVNVDTGATSATSAVLPFGTIGSPTDFPAGAAKVFTAKQIATFIGEQPASITNQARLKLTAPTDGLEAQTFILTNANGNFTDVSNAQVGQ